MSGAASTRRVGPVFRLGAELPAPSPRAERYLRLVLAGFAGSVVLTRAFLEWTGYPQIATGEFHIAHVLWGGLLLFIAALLLLGWRGDGPARWASLLAGAGFGLFIDEVGKFITQNNDYFHPLAAPIIYAFFLLTAFVTLHVRRATSAARPAGVPAVLELLEQATAEQAGPAQRAAIAEGLQQAAASPDPRAARLAAHALAFLQELPPAGEPAGQRSRWARLQDWAGRAITPLRLRRALTAGFALLALRGLATAVAAFLFIIAVADPARWAELAATSTPLSGGRPFGPVHLTLVSVTLVLEGLLGALFLAATAAMVARRTSRGLALGYWALLIGLTVVRLLVFYFNQFDIALTTLLQLGLLAGVVRYRAMSR